MPKGKPKLKTELITIRVEPRVKKAAEIAAQRNRRSLTNFIEVLVLDYCEAAGITLDLTSPMEKTDGKSLENLK